MENFPFKGTEPSELHRNKKCFSNKKPNEKQTNGTCQSAMKIVWSMNWGFNDSVQYADIEAYW